MTDKQIIEILFTDDLSIGQVEEIEETKEALKDPAMRKELERIARNRENR